VADSGTGINSEAHYMTRMAKLFADPLRIKIVMELNMREMSPKQFFDDFGGGSLSRVSRHFDVLVEYGWLHLVRTESGGKRRGAVEHFYRAIEPAVFHNETWSPLPKSMKEMISAGVVEELGDRLKEALAKGTLDARSERHLSWTPLRLDQRGWDSVIAKVDALFHSLFEEQEAANLRMAKSGEEAIPMIVGLSAFESPKDTAKAP
jgi:hypothetical protein